MAWKAVDRITPVVDPKAEPVLSEAVREKIRSFFPRYETKRAVLLPALHVVQDALGHVSHPVMKEIADLLEIAPSDVLDTISFYTHFWTHPKGKKVITVCRSISCQLRGGDDVFEKVQEKLGIHEHETTWSEEYSLVTEECLAGCDHAPCLLINEKLHKHVKPEDVAALLEDETNDRVAMKRSDLYDGPAESAEASTADDNGDADPDEVLGKTSSLDEMKDAD